jgi:hyperosmotically inducible protein
MMTTMTSKLALGFSSALLAAALIAPAVTVHARQGAGERAGEALDNAGRNIRRGVQNAFARSRATVHEQEVLARVYSRIHWDKMLVGSTLELEVRDDGTAVLRGAVPNKASKERAVVLARDTVGVTQVVDELTILPPARVIPAPPVTTEPAPAATISKP